MVEPLIGGEPLLGGEPLRWEDVGPRVGDGGPCWLTVVRPDGAPHTRPVLAVWAGGAVHVVMSPRSAKARLLHRNPRCSLAATLGDLDVVLDAHAIATTVHLNDVAAAYAERHGWQVDVRGGALWADGAPTAGPPPYVVHRLDPTGAHAFGTTQATVNRATRWRLPARTGVADRCPGELTWPQ